MRDKIIKQLFEKYQKEINKQTISQFTELYRQFNIECQGFRKKLKKIAGKEQALEISEAIDNIIEAYTDCFFELAYAYFDKGYFEGFISATKAVKSE